MECANGVKDNNCAVRLAGVTRTYDFGGSRIDALRGITADLPAGKFNVVIGASGSGKSTLLNLIGCIDTPTAGSIEVCGTDVTALSDDALAEFRARNIGYIFQNFNLIPVLSVYENVEYPLLLAKTAPDKVHERVMKTLETVGLTEFANHLPNEISGGQRQRTAIARALVKDPVLVLADEPTANLDHKTGTEIIQLMQHLQVCHKTTFVFSSHDRDLIANAEDIFMIMDGTIL
ncbi:MAG: ABC transporter ATP-binding protein [Elusimicrobiaceae bacterium]|nr:ABC transporter ATP-binding protein [Elusimicrobiaceae bacterium]